MNGKSILSKISILYLLLPFVIFVIGWTKLYIAIPVALVLVATIILIFKEKEVFDSYKIKCNSEQISKILIIVGICALWVYFSGIGKFVFQNQDHTVRNTIFETLVNNKWPVISDEGRTLTYYIGFWLPSALVGKIAGVRAGFCFQALWALMGILLVYGLLCVRRKKLAIWPLVVMVFFGGLDILGSYMMGWSHGIGGKIPLEWWSDPYQFTSITSQLFWVFNQSIPAWISTLLVIESKSNKYLVFILGISLLNSTLPSIGLMVIILYKMFAKKYKVNSKKEWMTSFAKDTFTMPNILAGGCTGVISALYLFANDAGTEVKKVEELSALKQPNLTKYLVFILFELGAFIIILGFYYKKRRLYYVLFGWLLLCPIIRVGTAHDFCMRASIPALFIVMLLMIDTISRAYKEKRTTLFALSIIVLAIGSLTPIDEMRRTLTNTYNYINQYEDNYIKEVSEETLMNGVNFSGSNQTFFYRNIAK